MKSLLTLLALFTLSFGPMAFAQESEFDDPLMDDFADDLVLEDDELFTPEEPAALAEPETLETPEIEAVPELEAEAEALDPFAEEETLIEEAPEPVAESLEAEPEVENTLVEEEPTHSSAGFSGSLPSSANSSFTVKNVSQDNADAESVGARPGDVLRYELRIASDVEDVKDYIASIDVSNVLAALDFTDTGLGVLENGRITYPAYSNMAPCEQVFTFFAQVKPDCGDIKTLNVSAEGDSTSVGTSCELAHTGPTQRMFLLIGIAILMISLVLGMSWRGRQA